MRLFKILPAFIAGLMAMLLVVPAAAALTDEVARVTSTMLTPNEKLQVQWKDGVVVLDGEVDTQRIDQIVTEVARIDGVDEIVNRLYID